MSNIWVILGMGAGVFTLRLAGLAMPVNSLPIRWKRALRIVPVALLAALVASSQAGVSSGDPARIVALGLGGLVAWRFGRIWLVIVVALGSFYVMRWLELGG